MRPLISFLLLCLMSLSFANATVYTVTNIDSMGSGSFPDALNAANANPGIDAIHFNIPGNGPHRIYLPSAWTTFNEITDGVRIDGTTQPGYTSVQPAIVFDGYPNAILEMKSSDVEITGIQFDRFIGQCLYSAPSWFVGEIHNFFFHHNLVTRSGPALSFLTGFLRNSNFRITDNMFRSASGIAYFDIGSTGGIYMEMDTVIIARNQCVIDTGYFSGIVFRSTGTGNDTANAFHVIIEDNDMQCLPGTNSLWGIVVDLDGTGGHNAKFRDFWIRRNTIVGHNSIYDTGITAGVSGLGGASTDAQYFHIDSNFVSHCNGGISLGNGGNCSFTAVLGHISIQGNQIIDNLNSGIWLGGQGTGGSARVDGMDVIGNEISGNVDGVSMAFSLPYGSGTSGSGFFNNINIRQNHIYSNLHSGIYFSDGDSSLRNGVVGMQRFHWNENSIHDNGWLGIAIDDLNTATQIECVMPVPILIQAGLSNDLFVEGNMNGAIPNTAYRLEYFLNQVADSSGMGEGQIFLGSDTIMLDVNGNGHIAWHGPNQSLGLFVSATATNLTTQNTGCFSNAVPTLPLSVEDDAGSRFVVYPNPLTDGDILRFSITGNVRDLRLVSLDGRVSSISHWGEVGRSGYFEVPPLASGHYYLVGELDGATIVKQIVVERTK
jgi:hypothetical protein